MTYSQLPVNSYFLSASDIFYKKRNKKCAINSTRSGEDYRFGEKEKVTRVVFARSCKKGKIHFIPRFVNDGDKCVHCQQMCKIV